MDRKHKLPSPSGVPPYIRSPQLLIKGIGLNRFAVGVPDEHLPKSLTGRFLTFKS